MMLSPVDSILGSGMEQANGENSFDGISMDVKNMMWQDGYRAITAGSSNGKLNAKSEIGL